jgi:hypothetical protein
MNKCDGRKNQQKTLGLNLFIVCGEWIVLKTFDVMEFYRSWV